MANEADVKRSVYDAIKDIFEDPTLWTNAFTVYGETDLEGLEQEPARPYVFILARKVAVEPRFLPIVALDIEIDWVNAQLGSMSMLAKINVHLLSRSEGEGSRIKSVLIPNLSQVTISSYDTSPPTQEAIVPLEGDWKTKLVRIPSEYAQEGSLTHWLVMSNELIVM